MRTSFTLAANTARARRACGYGLVPMVTSASETERSTMYRSYMICSLASTPPRSQATSVWVDTPYWCVCVSHDVRYTQQEASDTPNAVATRTLSQRGRDRAAVLPEEEQYNSWWLSSSKPDSDDMMMLCSDQTKQSTTRHVSRSLHKRFNLHLQQLG